MADGVRPDDDTGDDDRVGVRNTLGGTGTVGNAMQVGRIETFILNGPPPILERPFQLPPPVFGFVDREQPLEALDRLLTQPTGSDPGVTQLHGLPGVGKTATILEWGNRAHVREHFKDGQLYAEVAAGRTDAPMVAAEILGDFLRALGVPPDDIPPTLDGRGSLLRSITEARRVLFVVEDPGVAAQVMPLIPASSSCALVVTGNRLLDGVRLNGRFEVVPVPPLDAESGRRLLARIVGEARMAAEPDATDTIVRLCEGLPVALRVAGCLLQKRSGLRVVDLATDLARAPTMLDRLVVGGSPVVMRLFDAVYRELAGDVRLFYRSLAALPGRRLTVAVAAAAADVGEDEAVRLLELLSDASLLQPVDVDDGGRGPGGARYAVHSLVHLHARRFAEASRIELFRAERRVVAWYVGAIARADRVVSANRLRLTGLGSAPQGIDFVSKESAFDWCDREWANLLVVVRTAFDRGWDTEVVRLCEGLWPFYVEWHRHASAIDAFRLGAEAAVRLGDRALEARMRCQLSRPYYETGDFGTARGEIAAAEAAVGEALGVNRDDPAHVVAGPDADSPPSDTERLLLRLDASVREFRAQLAVREGDIPAGRRAVSRMIEINEAIGNTRGIALGLYLLGQVEDRDGNPARAVEVLTRSRELFPAADERLKARAETAIAGAYLRLGRYAEADRAARAAYVVMIEKRRSRVQAAPAAEVLAECLFHDGRIDEARDVLGGAVAVYREIESPRAADAARRLAEFGGQEEQGA